MKYTQELNIMLAKADKKKGWLPNKLGMSRMHFWRKVYSDTLTEGQKIKICKLLSAA